MAAILVWTMYAAWLALFARLAWQDRLRLLLTLAALMLICFAGCWAYVESFTSKPGYDHSGDLAAGILLLIAAGVLLGPLIIAAIAYPIGRVWAR